MRVLLSSALLSVGVLTSLSSAHVLGAGDLLDFMTSCGSDYSMDQCTDFELMSETYNTWPIHPMTVLACISKNTMMETQCANDIEGTWFTPCAATAYKYCTDKFINPGVDAMNASVWVDEFQPYNDAVQCLLNVAQNSTSGFPANDDESRCKSYIIKSPAWMCKDWGNMFTAPANCVSSYGCHVEYIDYLIQQTMMMGKGTECRTALSNFPMGMMLSSENASTQLLWTEVFYGLTLNPNGDPFYVSPTTVPPVPIPSDVPVPIRDTAPTDAPAKTLGGGAIAGIVIGCSAGVGLLAFAGIRARKSRVQAARNATALNAADLDHMDDRAEQMKTSIGTETPTTQP